MNKLEIVKLVTEKTGLPRKEVLTVLETLFETIADTMITKRESVTFRGFGSFIIKHRAEKTARNIQKNTTLIVPAHDLPAFKPAQEFEEKMKQK